MPTTDRTRQSFPAASTLTQQARPLASQRVTLLPQRILFGEQDPIHAPLIRDYRRSAGLPPGGVDEFGNRVGPSDAELKYSGLLTAGSPASPAARWLAPVINARNAAEAYYRSTPLIDPPGGLTTQFINAAEIHSNHDVEAAIPSPTVQSRVDGATTYCWFSQPISVTGHTRMDIFSAGPWNYVISRAQAGTKFSWNAACTSGTGDVTIHVDGRPDDAGLESYVRQGEAEHNTDSEQAFNNTIARYAANVNQHVGDNPSTRVSGPNLVACHRSLDALANRSLLTDFAIQLNAATDRRHAGGRHSAGITGLTISPDCSRVTVIMEAGTL
ncbi:MAG: hypothetical protein JXB85_15465 [Anaerolineales bacterium]|nr:hypothetical protein [Anaerolineales bacterium]